MPHRKALRKNYSKKAIRRRNATKRKRLGGGLWFTRRAKIHPVLSVSRLTETTPPDFEPYDPSVANFVSNLPTHIGIIKRSAQALEQIYNGYSELFNKIRHGYMKYATEGSVLSLYYDSYTREYETTIKSLIESLPDKQQYSEEEKDDTFNILVNIRSLSRQFLNNIDIDKFVSDQNFNEFEEIIFTQFTSVLRLIIKHCEPYNFE